MTPRSRTVLVVFVLAALASSTPTLPSTEANADPTQLVLKLSVIRETPKAPASTQTHTLLLRGDGTSASINSTVRVPIPSRPESASQADGVPMTTFTFQHVGLMVSAGAWASGNGARVRGQIEDSSILARDPLSTRNLNHSFDAFFPYGTPVRVAVLADPDGGSSAIEVRVDRVE